MRLDDVVQSQALHPCQTGLGLTTHINIDIVDVDVIHGVGVGNDSYAYVVSVRVIDVGSCHQLVPGEVSVWSDGDHTSSHHGVMGTSHTCGGDGKLGGVAR